MKGYMTGIFPFLSRKVEKDKHITHVTNRENLPLAFNFTIWRLHISREGIVHFLVCFSLVTHRCVQLHGPDMYFLPRPYTSRTYVPSSQRHDHRSVVVMGHASKVCRLSGLRSGFKDWLALIRYTNPYATTAMVLFKRCTLALPTDA
jgi:hypothetical protein